MAYWHFPKYLSVFLLCLFLWNVKAFALSAKSAVLIDAHNGRVLMAQDADRKMGMASTTKIMTALVAIESGRLEDLVTVSAKAAATEGSSMYLKGGEQLPMSALVYGLMLSSGNDAGVAIAEHISGDVDSFAALMNQKAQQLGLFDTNFTNPHGLDNEQHYTTAYDLAQLTRYCLQNPEFAKIVSTRSITVGSGEGARTLVNHNKMLSMYKGADGVKTGFTKKCGRCLVSSATRDCLQLIAVTLDAPDDWNDHQQMFDYGFSQYKWQAPIKEGSYMRTVSLLGSDADKVSLYAASDAEIAYNKNDSVKLVYDIPNFVEAPVIKGQTLGRVSVYLSDELVKTIELVAGDDAAETKKNQLINNFKYLFTELIGLGG